MSAKWWAIYIAYGAVVLFYVALLTLTGEEHPRTKALEILAWVVAPSAVFLAAAIPLQLGWRSPVGLTALGIVAGCGAFVLTAFTWGFVAPISLALLAVGVACVVEGLGLRAGVHGGERGRPRAQG